MNFVFQGERKIFTSSSGSSISNADGSGLAMTAWKLIEKDTNSARRHRPVLLS